LVENSVIDSPKLVTLFSFAPDKQKTRHLRGAGLPDIAGDCRLRLRGLVN